MSNFLEEYKVKTNNHITVAGEPGFTISSAYILYVGKLSMV